MTRPYPSPTGDSTRTDARGSYKLSFRNQKGLYYAVMVEPSDPAKLSPYYRLAFITHVNNDYLGDPNSAVVTVGKTNIVDFKPNELRTLAVRIRNHNTRYQRLDFDHRTLRGNALDTLVYLRGYYLPATGVQFRYYNVNAANQVVKDTLVALVVQNPAALPPDTVRATLTFRR